MCYVLRDLNNREDDKAFDFFLPSLFKPGEFPSWHNTCNKHPMIVFSTVLEVNGAPVLYKVYKNGQLAFLSPCRMPAPILFATVSEKIWEVKGTSDHTLKIQAVREIASAG